MGDDFSPRDFLMIDDVLNLPEINEEQTKVFVQSGPEINSLSQSPSAASSSILKDQIELILSENSLLEKFNAELEAKIAIKDKIIEESATTIKAYQAISSHNSDTDKFLKTIQELNRKVKHLEQVIR